MGLRGDTIEEREREELLLEVQYSTVAFDSRHRQKSKIVLALHFSD